jgi:NADPH:quinone reductase-like Zn-dependent oxidoreductase
MMLAAVARCYGGPEVVSIEQIPTPTAGPDDVLVHVAASSLNALDWHFLTGTPYLVRLAGGLRNPKRLINGADVAGTIVAVGDNVTAVKVGDAVFGEVEGGGLAHYLTTTVDRIVPLPDGVDFETAAAVPVAGLTAVQGLRTHGCVEPGDHVLINGAAGGVGTFAVQIAKALGADVTAVCSTRNTAMVRDLGADHVIDYTKADFADGSARFDVMMDNVGNRKPSTCVRVLRPDGRYVVISGPKTNRWLGPVPYIARSALAFLRADPSFHQFVASPNQDDLRYLGELVASGAVRPAIDRVVGLDGVVAGLDEIGGGHAPAKIVVAPSLT